MTDTPDKNQSQSKDLFNTDQSDPLSDLSDGPSDSNSDEASTNDFTDAFGSHDPENFTSSTTESTETQSDTSSTENATSSDESSMDENSKSVTEETPGAPTGVLAVLLGELPSRQTDAPEEYTPSLLSRIAGIFGTIFRKLFYTPIEIATTLLIMAYAFAYIFGPILAVIAIPMFLLDMWFGFPSVPWFYEFPDTWKTILNPVMIIGWFVCVFLAARIDEQYG